ncbi:MAG: amino acid adenylation domain-containing protein [Nostoc sp. DedSLP03]|uniref:non-ribosomal peptide synthetase n=1 Tax=Nostoc sp. DedSLP03 TaxID=3075400 RepID=UPI002AD518F6|nr:non-ribosomal peptide synthetase [Nostoc sp. DedSLP03]MDZ7963729.1 amino acid adenylation domain-containing protein [Nostoc sp. DedSLP03]
MSKETIQGFQLSPQQKHLWQLQESDSNHPYKSLCTILIEGKVDTETLKTALNNVVNRHNILRTTFHCLPGMNIPLQVINDSSILSIQNHNLIGLEPQEQDLRIEELFQEAKQQTIDFEQCPLLHISLITLSPSRYVLLVSLPAMNADAATLKNLMLEISQAYTACLYDEVLSDEAMQYILVSEWQNELLEAEEAEIGKDYWRRQNISHLFNLKLPFENQTASKTGFKPQILTQTIDPDVVVKIEELVSHYDTLLPTFLLSCWQILLWHLSKESEIIIGTSFNGRTDEEFKGALGLFAKYLPLHFYLDSNFKFTEVLEQVQLVQNDAYDWQECFAWEQILGTDAKYTLLPFFPFCFDFEELSTNCSCDEICFSIYKQYTCFDRFKLKLLFVRKNDSLIAELHYDSDIFCREDIKRLIGQFQTLLESVIENPQAALRKLDIIDSVERHQLLVEFNNTKTDYPQHKCLHELFEAQVERTPKNIAVVFEKEQLTYSELNAKANQLAHHLRKLGVGKEALVAICVERSLEMIIALLGVLKAGGTYLPVDPMYPKERVAFMLSDAQTSVLLTQQRLLKSLPEQGTQIVCLDTDWESIAQESEENLCRNGIQPDNLAYVIYTSGSTGKPKGVMISHSSICNHMFWMQSTFPLTKEDKLLQKTPFSFDASVWEFYAPLLIGAQLIVARPGGHQDSAYIVKAITDQKITVLQLVPTLLRMLLEQEGIENCKSLKRIFCGGEVLPVALQERLFVNLDVELHNLYGPTEACIDATFWTCKRGMHQQSVPIGRPISNTQVYILDSNLQPVPIGVPGELYIGGAGLARGYLNRPDLTKEKFIPNPFNDESGMRLYKTGDLAYYRNNGTIEYICRTDNQVKIRGFRIELAEIEAVLSSHPQIQQAVVIATEDTFSNKKLVAYVVSEQETLSNHQLREFLQQRLPAYMMPSAFVSLDTLPLTPNGKIDRLALPAPDGDIEREREYVVPRTPSEEIIADIFALVLGIETVGIHDNFFELGGHSLLATQLISRLRQSFEVEIPLQAVFATPSVAQLDQTIAQLRTEEQSLNLPLIERIAPDTEKIPLSFAQERLWFLDQLEPDSAAYNMPAAVRIEGKLQPTSFQRSISEIIRRHEVLRTNFVKQDGEAIQIIHPATDWKMTTIDLQALPANQQETEIKSLATTEAAKPFNLATDSLIRGTLLALSDSEHVLLLTMHHIVSDGWSIGVFIQEIATLYYAFVEGKPSPLPELPIQYADFAVWQRQWLQGEELQNQLNYWQKQLAGAPALLELTTDYPRPAVQTFRGASQSLHLSKTLTEGIKTLSHQEGVTLFVTLFATFTCLLYYYTGQEDIVVGTAVANRNRTEVEQLIGFFVNQLVLRTDLSGNPTFAELLGRVREVALGAYAHQDLPFETLVGAMKSERDPSRTPLFQIKFVFQNTPISDIKLSKLNINFIEVDNKTTKFDLLLNMEETKTGLFGLLEYNTDLFKSTTITRFLEQFKTLLSHIVVQPHIRLNTIKEILSEADRQRQLVKEKELQEVSVQKLKKSHRRNLNNSPEIENRL